MADERLLIATRIKDGKAEAEPVRVEHTDETTILVMDDGERVVFDATELRAAA